MANTDLQRKFNGPLTRLSHRARRGRRTFSVIRSAFVLRLGPETRLLKATLAAGSKKEPSTDEFQPVLLMRWAGVTPGLNNEGVGLFYEVS
jgi:hypothetical protein